MFGEGLTVSNRITPTLQETLRSLRESVELDFGTLLEGAEGSMPTADVLRPGGSVGLLTGMVVDTYAPEGVHGRHSSEVRARIPCDNIA